MRRFENHFLVTNRDFWNAENWRAFYLNRFSFMQALYSLIWSQKKHLFSEVLPGMFFNVKYYLAAGTKVNTMFAVLPPNSIGDFKIICVLERSVNTKR